MIKLATEYAPELPAIMGVESEIREALINLILTRWTPCRMVEL